MEDRRACLTLGMIPRREWRCITKSQATAFCVRLSQHLLPCSGDMALTAGRSPVGQSTNDGLITMWGVIGRLHPFCPSIAGAGVNGIVSWKIAGISAGAPATRTDRFALPCGKPALHLIDGRVAGKGAATNKPGEDRDGAVCWIDIRFRRSFMPAHPLAGLCMNPCWKFLVASTPDWLHLHPGD